MADQTMDVENTNAKGNRLTSRAWSNEDDMSSLHGNGQEIEPDKVPIEDNSRSDGGQDSG